MSKEKTVDDRNALVEHFERLMFSAEAICLSPKSYFLVTPALGLSLSFIGGGQIPLGLALEGWRDQSLVVECSKCNHEAFCLFYVAGSILSGLNQFNGYCRSCKKLSTGSGRPAFEKGRRFLGRLSRIEGVNLKGDPLAEASGMSIVTDDGETAHFVINENGFGQLAESSVGDSISLKELIALIGK